MKKPSSPPKEDPIITLQKLWNEHQEQVLPKIIDLAGGDSTEELRKELDLYDSHVSGLVVSVLDNATDHIQSDWLKVPENENSMDSRIAAIIAIVEDIHEPHQVALEYRIYKKRLDKMFELVRELLAHKM
eukprot:Phypoly_transcript_29851.p1 GENE.Phypoly_transcript_29851~~Phypoly_transcript_29851.p1  ORF type:complete len:140 (+),score=19.61 Phypoly_transcript_29851:33-422(+)